jgi:hypothetical protein
LRTLARAGGFDALTPSDSDLLPDAEEERLERRAKEEGEFLLCGVSLRGKFNEKGASHTYFELWGDRTISSCDAP